MAVQRYTVQCPREQRPALHAQLRYLAEYNLLSWHAMTLVISIASLYNPKTVCIEESAISMVQNTGNDPVPTTVRSAVTSVKCGALLVHQILWHR
jgi:hypothetical protein